MNPPSIYRPSADWKKDPDPANQKAVLGVLSLFSVSLYAAYEAYAWYKHSGSVSLSTPRATLKSA
jgi:hypothetical protein